MIGKRTSAAARVVVVTLLSVAVLAGGRPALAGGRPALAVPGAPESATDASALVPAAQVTPTLSTNASSSVPVGGAITDTATLDGGTGPTGSITFSVFGPNSASCAGSPLVTSTATVMGNNSYVSAPYTPPQAGTYQFAAAYSGDATNTAVTDACAANESVVVTKVTPTVVSAAVPDQVVLGGPVTDTASLAGGDSPTGTIAFALYGPNDPSCAQPPVNQVTATVSGDGSYTSAAFTPAQAGTYVYTASYSGDTNNAPVAVACGASGESVSVGLAAVFLAATASGSVSAGQPVDDMATLTGGSNPTGTITFRLFGPNNATCTGSPLVTSTVTVSGDHSYTSAAYIPTQAGAYQFTAAYSGDAANSVVNPSCGVAGESVTIGKATTALSSTASAPVALNGSIFDNASLAGGVNPTGTITFDLYGQNDSACSGPVLLSPSVTVNGNGTYSSGSILAAVVGSYGWVVTYSGDANNAPASSPCGTPGETSTVFSTGSPSGSVGSGYWLLAADGGIFNYGTASFLGSAASIHLNAPIVGMAATPDRKGYWIVGSDGGVFIYGDAAYFGSAASVHLNKPIVAIATTPDRKGYWMVASDGGIFNYGDAAFYGSAGSLHLNSPIVGMVATPDGKGYWMVAADGGIFAYGDAAFSGSAGSLRLNKPIVGMAAMPVGAGYWLVASDGGIFGYGTAKFLGSTGATHLNKPIVGMATTSDGGGYWLGASDGGVFTYGDAGFSGSAGAKPLNKPIVGVAAG